MTVQMNTQSGYVTSDFEAEGFPANCVNTAQLSLDGFQKIRQDFGTFVQVYAYKDPSDSRKENWPHVFEQSGGFWYPTAIMIDDQGRKLALTGTSIGDATIPAPMLS